MRELNVAAVSAGLALAVGWFLLERRPEPTKAIMA